MLLLGSALFACSALAPAPKAGDPADTGRDSGRVADTADTAVDTGPEDTGDPDGDGLVGVRLDPPIDPFAFLVENQRREPRDPDWLVGDPSVVWFFRDAGST